MNKRTDIEDVRKRALERIDIMTQQMCKLSEFLNGDEEIGEFIMMRIPDLICTLSAQILAEEKYLNSIR